MKAFETLPREQYAIQSYIHFLEKSGRQDEADSVREKSGMDG
jgi:hypothetical protein